MTKTPEEIRKGKPQRLGNCGSASIQAYIPNSLSRVVIPYYGDFAQSLYFDYVLIARLMAEGFLPIATKGILLPKLHNERSVVQLPEQLHMSKSTRKKAKRFSLSINTCFDDVVKGCHEQHEHCWLHPPLVDAFRSLNSWQGIKVYLDSQKRDTRSCSSARVRLYSIEVWSTETGALVAGELGYTVGSIFTSLTGFSRQDSAGSVQLIALGSLLAQSGFEIWDLGMDMKYKRDLGAQLMPRATYVDAVHRVRETRSSLIMPRLNKPLSCKSILGGVSKLAPVTVANSTATPSGTKTPAATLCPDDSKRAKKRRSIVKS